MRNKIFVLTDDLTFFYRLNKELKRLNIKNHILNFYNKIPTLNSLILTTTEEIKKINNLAPKNVVILPYNKIDSFEKYILKILAAYRIGYKENYSELTFSVDPGMKHFGLVVFLDDYYLLSITLYEKQDLINIIKNYVNFLEDSSKFINLVFKFGRDVLPITLDLVKSTYQLFEERERINVYLIDEAKSSKIKIPYKKRNISKHEASALILALRDGIEVSKDEQQNVKSLLKLKRIKERDFKKDKIEYENEFEIFLGEIAEKVLDGELTLSKSTHMIKNYKNK